jgi:hypothetical protein
MAGSSSSPLALDGNLQSAMAPLSPAADMAGRLSEVAVFRHLLHRPTAYGLLGLLLGLQ